VTISDLCTTTGDKFSLSPVVASLSPGRNADVRGIVAIVAAVAGGTRKQCSPEFVPAHKLGEMRRGEKQE